MKSFIVAAAVIGVFCVLQVTANKMCYYCMNCDKVDDSTETCNTTTSCMKVSVTKSGNTTVTRSCGVAVCKSHGCMTEGDTETCCCEQDKCNGAGSLTSALIMVVAPVVAGFYFTRS